MRSGERDIDGRTAGHGHGHAHGHEKEWRSGRGYLLLIVALFALTCVALAPKVINGDGIGYLKGVDGDHLSPGHLAYLPLVRAIARVVEPGAATELVGPLRAVSLAAVLGALLLFFCIGQRLFDPRRALLATALLGASNAVLRAGSEVEVYGLALFLSLLALYLLLRCRDSADKGVYWAGLAGAAVACAALFHLTLVLLYPSMVMLIVWWRRRGRRWHVLFLTLTFGLVLLIGLYLGARSAHVDTLAAAWKYYLGADHGIP